MKHEYVITIYWVVRFRPVGIPGSYHMHDESTAYPNTTGITDWFLPLGPGLVCPVVFGHGGGKRIERQLFQRIYQLGPGAGRTAVPGRYLGRRAL